MAKIILRRPNLLQRGVSTIKNVYNKLVGLRLEGQRIASQGSQTRTGKIATGIALGALGAGIAGPLPAIGRAGTARIAPGAVSQIGKGLTNVARFLAPSFKPSVVATRGLATLGVETAYKGAKALAAGSRTPSDYVPGVKGIAYAGLSGIFPPAALAGYAVGGGEKKIKETAQYFQSAWQSFRPNIPQVPSAPTINVNVPQVSSPSINLPGELPTVSPGEYYFQTPQIGGGFNPSVSVGGYDPFGGLQYALLAGGLGALGGFALGRRSKRKKRKKYKRRKRRK